MFFNLFNFVWVAEWPSFGAAHPVDHVFFCVLTFCNFSYFPFLFCFGGRVCVLIASVPGLCIRFTFRKQQEK